LAILIAGFIQAVNQRLQSLIAKPLLNMEITPEQFEKIKGSFPPIFSRFEKPDVVFLAFIHFALIVEALRVVGTRPSSEDLALGRCRSAVGIWRRDLSYPELSSGDGRQRRDHLFK
jgi:hypothetical protein